MSRDAALLNTIDSILIVVAAVQYDLGPREFQRMFSNTEANDQFFHYTYTYKGNFLNWYRGLKGQEKTAVLNYLISYFNGGAS